MASLVGNNNYKLKEVKWIDGNKCSVNVNKVRVG